MSNNKQSGKEVKVTLIKSISGRLKDHKACVQGLGLKRIGQAVTVKNDACIEGMIKKVSYLLKVEEK